MKKAMTRRRHLAGATERPRFRISGGYGISAGPSSLGLDVGRPDHLGPFLGFFRDQLAEVGGRAGKHRAAQVGKPRLELGIGEGGVDLLVEPVDNLCRRVLGAAEAIKALAS